MKKLAFVFCFLFLFVNLAYAMDPPATFSINRNVFSSKETLQGNLILGVNLTNKISESNFVLSDGQNNAIPIALFINQLSQSNYFVYFNLPSLKEGNYSFSVKDLIYLNSSEGKLRQIMIKQPFIIDNYSENSSISINPGILLNGKYLDIKDNLGPINVSIDAPQYTNLSGSFTLQDQIRINLVDLSDNYNLTVSYGTKNYLVQVINNAPTEIISNPRLLVAPYGSIIFLNSTLGYWFPDEINMTSTSIIYNPVYIANVWNQTVSNISLSVSGNLPEILTLDNYSINTLGPNQTFQDFIYINGNFTPKNYYGSILINQMDNVISSLGFKINLIQQDDIFNENTTPPDQNLTYPSIPYLNQTNQTGVGGNPPKQNYTFFIVFFILVVIAAVIYIVFKMRINKKETFGEHFYKFKR